MNARSAVRFPIIDADSHVYEPASIWNHYVPAAERAAARSAFWCEVNEHGDRLTVLNGRPAPALDRSRLVRQALWHPGDRPETIGALDPEAFRAINPGAWDPEARLADMDAMGIAQAVLFPTLFAEYLPVVENPDAAATLTRAYNDWIWDFAQADPARLHPAAVLPLQSVLLARRELERVAKRGFRAVTLRPMFYAPPPAEREQKGGGSLSMSYVNPRGIFLLSQRFAPLWAEIERAKLVACIHPSCGITNPEPTSAGSFVERIAARMRIGHTVAEPVAGMQDNGIFFTAAFFQGLLEDHPNLRLAILHSGASWVPLALEKAETYLWLSIPSVFARAENPVSLEPGEVFETQPAIVSFDGWEASVARLHDDFASTAAFGSRYPSHETSTPQEALEMLGRHGVPEATAARLMGGNAAELFGVG